MGRPHRGRPDGGPGAARRAYRPSPGSSEPLDPLSRRAPDDLPCQVHGPDLWFAQAPRDLERAKRLCGPCPAKSGCLAGAIERGEPAGVWGGQIFDDGRIVARKRPRGRPRKDASAPQGAQRNSIERTAGGEGAASDELGRPAS